MRQLIAITLLFSSTAMAGPLDLEAPQLDAPRLQRRARREVAGGAALVALGAASLAAGLALALADVPVPGNSDPHARFGGGVALATTGAGSLVLGAVLTALGRRNQHELSLALAPTRDGGSVAVGVAF